MNIHVPKNVAKDWAKIRQNYDLPSAQMIANGLVDIAERGNHYVHIQDIPKTGKIGGVEYSGKPIARTPSSDEKATIAVNLTDAQYQLVRAHLRRSVVPITVPQAIGYLRLYYIGSADERVTVYNLG